MLVVMSDNRPLRASLEEADYNSLAAAINKSYCDRMGYGFRYYRVYHRDPASHDLLNCRDPHSPSMRHAAWSKLLALRHALLTSIDMQCCYMDSDAAFVNWSRRIEELAGPTDLTFQNNLPFPEGPCSGFIILRRSPRTLEFLARWYGIDAGAKNTQRTWEQDALLPLLASAGYPYSLTTELAFPEVDGQLVRHLTAVGSEELRKPWFTAFIARQRIDFRRAIESIAAIDFDSATDLDRLQQETLAPSGR